MVKDLKNEVSALIEDSYILSKRLSKEQIKILKTKFEQLDDDKLLKLRDLLLDGQKKAGLLFIVLQDIISSYKEGLSAEESKILKKIFAQAEREENLEDDNVLKEIEQKLK